MHCFVWQLVAREFAADAHREAVVRGEIALIVGRKVARGSSVRKIWGHDRIQIVRGPVAACAHAESILAPNVLTFEECGGRIVTAPREHGLAVKAGSRILRCIELDDPSHFAAVFRGNARRIDRYRVDVVRFEFGTKAGRAVVGERDSVNDKLSLIFRSTWMENRIAFVQPSWLSVNQILYGTARKRGKPVLDSRGADLVDRARLIWIDERIAGGDRHLRTDRSDLKGDFYVGG